MVRDEPACKPDSVARGPVIIHLRTLLPASFCACAVRPTRKLGRAALGHLRGRACSSFLVLLQVGFAEPPQSPGVLVVSYTAVSP